VRRRPKKKVEAGSIGLTLQKSCDDDDDDNDNNNNYYYYYYYYYY